MNKYSSLFSQLLSLFPRLEFERLVRQTGTEYAAKGFSSWGHYVAMLFCQLGQAHSLREICNGQLLREAEAFRDQPRPETVHPSLCQ